MAANDPPRGTVTSTMSLVATAVVALVTVGVVLWGVLRQHSEPSSSAELRVNRVAGADEVEVGSVRQRRTVQLVTLTSPGGTGQEACLDTQARALLEAVLPPGTDVVVRVLPAAGARGGLEPATVTRADGRSVEVELVRQGLAAPSGVPGPHASALAAAQDQARADGRGFYDRSKPCTVPGQVQAAVHRLETAVPTPGPGGGVTPATAVELDAALGQVLHLRDLLDRAADRRSEPRWAAMSDDDLTLLRARLDAAAVGSQAARLALVTAPDRVTAMR